MISKRRTNSSSTDVRYTERVRLLKANPEQYYREYPRPRFGFVDVKPGSSKRASA